MAEESRTSANSNITHVNIIEGLISQVKGHIEALSPQTVGESESKYAALGSVVTFQENGLVELHRVFE